MGTKQWQILPPLDDETKARFGDLPPLLAQLLHNRGLRSRAQALAFLAADRHLCYDPFLMAGMAEAVERVLLALSRGELIGIFGDFDADGIAAAALLAQGLSALGGLGGRITVYIPHRADEGYGLNTMAIDRLFAQGVSLLITADCGITNAPEVAYAQSLDIDTIITDHHLVPQELPQALAIVNPRRPDCSYPFKGLSGCGVAFKLLQGVQSAYPDVFGSHSAPDDEGAYLDLVALGTVADLSPLVDENRYLVKRGLEILNQRPRLGIREMCVAAGLRPGSIGADTIAYTLAPRLNAAGRLDDALPSYQLLVTASVDEAKGLAQFLEQSNRDRQRLTSQALDRAREQVLASGQETAPIIIVQGRGYGEGIVGLVAGRLSEEFGRPAFVIDVGDEVARGSGRSIPEFNLVAALSEPGVSRYLLRFGGHSRAAGFTAATQNLETLCRRLRELAEESLCGVALEPWLVIDAEVPLRLWAQGNYRLIRSLAPFGSENPEPVFVSRRLRVVESRTLGTTGEHLRLKLLSDDAVWEAIGFGLGGLVSQVSPRIDIAYSLGVDRFAGYEALRLEIKDLLPAAN